MPNLRKYVKLILNKKKSRGENETQPEQKQPVQEVNNEIPLSYKYSEVEAAFIAASDRFRQEWLKVECTDEDFQRYKKLKEARLTKSATMKEIEEKRHSMMRMKCFSFFSMKYPHSLCISFKEFKRLLLKFGLVCGNIFTYRGYITDEKLEEIVEIGKLLEFIKKRNKYSNKKDDDSFFEITTKVFISPFGYRPILPDEMIKRQEMSAFPFDIDRSYTGLMSHKRLCNTDLLIAAPCGEIKSLFPVERRCDTAILFQLCPYGAVIFNMWETFKN